VIGQMTISADAVLGAIIALSVALLTGAFILTRELASVNSRVSDLANALGRMNESIDARLKLAILEHKQKVDGESSDDAREFRRDIEMDLARHFALLKQELRREFVDRPEFGAHVGQITERITALERHA
jgi:hypothetical protein